MTIKKVKLNDIAKDLNIPAKEVAEFIAGHYGMEPKKPSSVLTEQEVNLVFEHYTSQNQVQNFDAYFASRSEAPAPKAEKPRPAAERPRERKLKFSFKEQREFETIDDELAKLEADIAACQAEQAACGSDYVKLQELQARQAELEAALEEKTERWVYLNELKEQIDAQNG